MFRRFAFVLLTFMVALPLYAQFEGPGVFVLEGFSNQQLSFQPLNGTRVPLGELGPTSVRLRQINEYLCVLHGDDFASGRGSALWIASFDDIREAAAQGGALDWEVVDLPDNTNPYDVLLLENVLFVSNQQSSEVVVLDREDEYNVVRRYADLPYPQGLASNGTYVCVANSDYGYGNTVTLFSATTLDSITTLEVWDNPQEIAVDDQGRFHVVCSGRSWEDVPAKSAVINYPLGNPDVQFIDLPGNPGETVFMVGPEDFGGKVVFGDEYATVDVHVSAYRVPELQLDNTAPLSHPGGWALASGNNGIFVGSSINNTLVFMGSDWQQYTVIYTFDSAIADLLFFDAGMENSVGEQYAAQPSAIMLGPAWPNPFNATTSVTLSLSKAGQVHVELFDITGRLAGTLVEGMLPRGNRRLTVDAAGLSSGVYIVRATSAAGISSQRITLVR
ncbi:T9SS type A sorting domain-containing protein [bacterium]|nr:T9SS type A sorting domain-containing protein [bacterium]